MKVVDLLEKNDKKGVLGMLIVAVLGSGKLLADGEVNRQMQIYFIKT